MPVEPDSESNESTSQPTSPSEGSSLPELPTKGINKRIAVASTLAAVGLFFSSRLDFGVSLKDLTAAALPYEEVIHTQPDYMRFFLQFFFTTLLSHGVLSFIKRAA